MHHLYCNRQTHNSVVPLWRKAAQRSLQHWAAATFLPERETYDRTFRTSQQGSLSIKHFPALNWNCNPDITLTSAHMWHSGPTESVGQRIHSPCEEENFRVCFLTNKKATGLCRQLVDSNQSVLHSETCGTFDFIRKEGTQILAEIVGAGQLKQTNQKALKATSSDFSRPLCVSFGYSCFSWADFDVNMWRHRSA